ncbi:FUSC family protein [Microbacterium paulum]
MSGSDPHTTTVAVRTGWRARLSPRRGLERVRDSAGAITQIVIAATAAFAFAHYALGHATPLLAATVTVSSLGLVRDARPRRVLETVIGMIIGILIAELIVLVAGIGWWQLGITLAVSLVVARFLADQPAFAIAAAIQAAIVMVIPASVPFLRLVDGIVGGVAALLVTALVPRSPLRQVAHEGAAVIAAFDDAVLTLVQALRRGDPRRAARGLEKARALQAPLDAWRQSIESAAAEAAADSMLCRQADGGCTAKRRRGSPRRSACTTSAAVVEGRDHGGAFVRDLTQQARSPGALRRHPRSRRRGAGTARSPESP